MIRFTRTLLLIIVVLQYLNSFSQEFSEIEESEIVNQDTLIGKGRKLQGERFGRWSFYFQNDSLAEIRIYSIDTNVVSCSRQTKRVLKEFIAKINTDSIAFSFENTEIIIDSSSALLTHLKLPIYRRDKKYKVRSCILALGTMFYLTEYDSTGRLESLMPLNDGQIHGVVLIWNYSNNEVAQITYSLGVPMSEIVIRYNDIGELLQIKSAVNLSTERIFIVLFDSSKN